MSPSFSAEAARIYSGLAAFGLAVTEVHIVLTGPDGSKKDTVIAFPASQDQITIEIPVPSSGTDQAFDALIELRNDQHVVLFSGRQTVIARAANLPTQTPPLVVISYTGPGKSTKTVTFSPPDTTIAGSTTVGIKATAVDSAGLPVPNLLVKFTVSDATLAVATSTGDATGTLSGLGKRGIATVSAITPLGVTGSSRITFVPPAARVVVISGSGQTGVAGSALAQPLVVEVQATDNLPVPGALVTFRAVTAGGSVQRTTAIADASGRATSTLTLGTVAGAYVYEAGSATLAPVSVSATATPAPPAAIAIVSGDAQTDTIGRTLALPLVVKVTDQFGGPAAGATVTWTTIAGNGTPSASSTSTGASGTTSITYTLGTTASNDTIRASVAGVSGSVLFSARAVIRSPAAITILSGDNQTGLPNTTLPAPLVARVSDAQSNPVSNATVTWSASGTGVTFNPVSSATDALGQATTRVTLGATPGTTTITATAGTATTTTTVTTSSGQTTLSIFAGDQQSTQAGTAVPLVPGVVLKDGLGNPVANAPVVFAVASGGGSITGATTTTNSSGVATVGSWTLGATPGPNTLTATSGTLSVTFSATGTSGAATKLLITTQPAATVVNQATFAPVPVVQLADVGGNPVSTAGVLVTATFASGPTTPTPVLIQAGATTNASGQATFAGMAINGPFGTYTLSFSAPGVTPIVSNAIVNGAGPANTLLLFGGNAQNAAVGTPVGVPPLAKVIDAQGNGVPGVVVTFHAVTAGSTISNGATTGTTVTVTTNSIGVAQLSAWTMSSTAGPHAVTASATVPNGSPVTFTANATAGGASRFILGQPLPTQIAVATAFPPIQVQIADANGNPVSQAGVSVTLTGNVQPSGQGFSITSTTNAQGIATLQPTPYTGTVGNAILSISATGYTTFTSAQIPVVAGPASTIIITTQPSTTAQNGVLLAQQPAVQVVDAGNNPVSTAGIPINVTATGAAVGGTSTINTNASGQAVFTNLFITGPVGAHSLQFTEPSLNPALSSVINLTAGPAASMSIDAGNGQTAAAGSMMPILPSVLVKDAGGNPVPGVNVLFTAVTAGSLIDDVSSKTITTNAQGIAAAQFFWMLSPTVGTNTLTASASGISGSPLTFTATGTPGPAANLKLLQAVPASITVGLPFPAPVQVQLVDANDNPVSQGGVVVTATANVLPSNTTFALNATTASNGVATFNLQPYIGTIGTMTFTLTAPSITTLVTPGINVLAGSPSKVVIATQPPTTATSGAPFAPQPTVQVTDVGSNAVSASTSIVATIQTGSGTLGGATTAATNASGLATFTNLSLSGAPGSFTLNFAASGLTAAVSNSISLGSATPTTLVKQAGDNQTATVGTAVAIAPSVLVIDGTGNPVPGVQVTFLVASGAGTVTGTPATTNASGVATLGSWSLGTATGGNSLTASLGALSTTFNATGIAAAPSRLGFNTQPPTTATSGAALSPQPIIQLQDAFGNATGGAGVTITAVISTGSGTLTNATATTVSGGLATFSGLAVNGSGSIVLQFQSGALTPVTSQPISLSTGPAANIVFSVQPAGGTGGTAFSPAVTVRLVDGSGNTVANNTNTATLTITSGTGTTGATLTGGGPVTFVNGVATFPTAAIDFGGTGYTLRATTNALNAAGAPIPVTTTAAFNIAPGPTQLLTTKAGTRVSVAAVGATNPPTVTRPVFVAKNAQGTPAPGLTVNVVATGRCQLDNGTALFTTLSYTSDSNGEVTPLVRLPTLASGSGCLIRAAGPTFTAATDSAQIAVYPAQTSHVWTGATSSNWQTASNWIPVISVPNVPSSTSDNVFIPTYNPGGATVPAVVSGTRPSMNKLSMDSAAFLDLANIGIDIGGGGVTGFGLFLNGSVRIQGSALVSGFFDVLDVGQTASCGSLAPIQPKLQTVHANVLNVFCHTVVDTLGVSAVAVNVFANGGLSWLDLPASANLVVTGNASFNGDSLSVSGGTITVSGTTTFGGGVSFTSGSTFSSGGDVIFASRNAQFSNANVVVNGNATFGGTGAGRQGFAGGTLSISGNFSQIAGTVTGQTGQTFSTSSDHITNFVGSTQQNISFATPTTSSFSVLRLQNSSAAGVQLATNAQIVNGTVQPRVDILSGRLQVNSGANFTLNSGVMHLGLNTNLNLLGNILSALSCTGRTTNNATITGAGLWNGTAYTAATCTP